LQERPSFASTAATSISLAYASNLTAGSLQHVFGTCDGTKDFAATPVSDSKGTAFGATLDNVNDGTNQQRIGHWASSAVTSGADTVTVFFNASAAFNGIWIKEVGGVSSIDKTTGANQQTPTTGTDSTSSGQTSTLTSQPALVSGLSMRTAGGSGPNVGTGFTDTWGALDWSTQARSENKRVTSTAGVAATFTALANVAHTTIVAVFREPGPYIAVVNPRRFVETQTGISIIGAAFGAAQGTLKICPTDNVADANAVSQTVTAWGDTSITFTAVAGTGSLGSGATSYVFVTDTGALSNASGYPVNFAVTAKLAWTKA
jgi:hypothetical protein